MAKKEEKVKIVLERTYNVPLRRRWLLVPRHRRGKKAIKTLKDFLIKHMKPEKDDKGRILLKLGKYLNEHIWKHGIKNPPHHVKITTTKDDKGLVWAKLVGAPVDKPVKEDKKNTKAKFLKKSDLEKKAGPVVKEVKEKPVAAKDVKKEVKVEEKPVAPVQKNPEVKVEEKPVVSK